MNEWMFSITPVRKTPAKRVEVEMKHERNIESEGDIGLCMGGVLVVDGHTAGADCLGNKQASEGKSSDGSRRRRTKGPEMGCGRLYLY